MRLSCWLAGSFAMLWAGTAIGAVDPAAVPAPSFHPGDSWVFDQTVERGQNGFGQMRLDMDVERLDGDTMTVGLKRDGAPGGFEDHILGADWSQRRLIDGEQAVTTRPFTFPMKVGESWTVDFTDPTPRGAQRSLHVHRTYTVVGWEDVTVPAGTFHALKIEAKGVDKSTIQVAASAVGGVVTGPGSSTSLTHVQRGGVGILARATYAEFYYVPHVKNYVKSIEEQYNADNVRVIRDTRTLVSYKLGA